MYKRMIVALCLLCICVSFGACNFTGKLLGGDGSPERFKATDDAETSTRPIDYKIDQWGETATENTERVEGSMPEIVEESSSSVSEDASEEATVHTEAPPSAEPLGLYYIYVTWSEHPIYSEPDYRSEFVMTVQEAGIYTIMEEVRDENGRAWGRLKSGVGWIDTTGLDREYLPHILLTVDYADDDIITGDEYIACIADDTEYTFPFVFRAQQTIWNVTLANLEFSETGYVITNVIGIWTDLTVELPLVVWGSFPGDTSAYYISFTDSAGQLREYIVTMSGLDGSLVLLEY